MYIGIRGGDIVSFDRLQDKIDELRNPSVVGLDPALEHIPPQILDKHFA